MQSQRDRYSYIKIICRAKVKKNCYNQLLIIDLALWRYKIKAKCIRSSLYCRTQTLLNAQLCNVIFFFKPIQQNYFSIMLKCKLFNFKNFSLHNISTLFLFFSFVTICGRSNLYLNNLSLFLYEICSDALDYFLQDDLKQYVRVSYNIIKKVNKNLQEMSSLNIISKIGMGFFWVKFYVFIGLLYVFNFFKHFLERIVYGNSKTVICPFKKTHEHVFLPFDQLIMLEGFSLDHYEFQTPDHAFVSFWRVRSKNPDIKQQQYPILLLHGLLDCSISWFLHADKTKCLPYILADQGYDVWVGNNRGTSHSKKNSHMPNYWDYCFDHFVQYDQPTMINSILKETQKQKLIYIGHSQGSTQFLVSTGVHDFDDKIICFIGMGTVISLQNVNHTVLKYLAKFNGVQILRFLGFKTVLSLPRWATKATGVLIYNTKFYFSIFFNIVNMLCGKPINNKIDTDRLGVIISHEPGGASIPNVLQWVQFYRSGKMAKFDYGKKKNQILYGSEQAPQYSFKHLKELKFNTYIFKGQVDSVISAQDYQKLQKLMNQDKFYTHELHDYAHLDYVWGKQANQDIYHKIVEILQKEGQC